MNDSPGNNPESSLREIEDLLNQSKQCLGSEPEKARVLSERAIEMARELDATRQLGQGLAYLSRALSIMEGTPQAIRLAEQSVEILSEEGRKDLLAYALNNLGNCRRRRLQLVKAMDCYRRALEAYEELGDSKGVSTVCNNMGIAYSEMSSYEQSYQAYKRSQKTAAEVGYDLGVAIALDNLADLLVDQGDLETAEKYLLEGLAVNRKVGRKVGIGFCLWGLGKLKHLRGNLGEAERYLKEGISVYRELGGRSDLLPCLYRLADVLEDQERPEEAVSVLQEAVGEAEITQMPSLLGRAKAKLASVRFRMGELEGVEEELLEAIDVLEGSVRERKARSKVCKVLSEFYERVGRLEDALLYHKLESDIDREILENERQQDIVKLRLRSEYERSENERMLLRKQRSELERANRKLQEALDKVKTLSGMLPICARCKKVRKDDGYWEQIERYVTEHSEAVFSHGLCPDCLREMYPELEGKE